MKVHFILVTENEGQINTEILRTSKLQDEFNWDLTDKSGNKRGVTGQEAGAIAAVGKLMQDLEGELGRAPKAFSFHSSNRRAKVFATIAEALFAEKNMNIDVDRVDGMYMTSDEREEKLKEFRKAERARILANCKVSFDQD